MNNNINDSNNINDLETEKVMKHYLKKLQVGVGVGVDTLLSIAIDGNASRSERINASAKLIEQAQKAYEIGNLEERIKEMERLAKENSDND